MSQLDPGQVLKSSFDETNQSMKVRQIAGNLITDPYDYIALTYVTSGPGTGEIQTVTYKSGGSGGTTVGVLTLTYDGSNRIATITKS